MYWRFVLLFVCVCGKKVNTDFLNLISTSTAIQTTEKSISAVLQLLNDLKSANEEASRKAIKFF